MHEIVTEKASVKTTTFKQFAGYLESIANRTEVTVQLLKTVPVNIDLRPALSAGDEL